jgi:hypothetical protein
MNFRKMSLTIPLFAFALAAAPMALAQSDNPNNNPPSASSDMHAAGSDAGSAAENAYHGTTRAVKDTVITARVKTALHEDKEIGHNDIHVDTIAGVVTLSGSAPTVQTAQRAEADAEQTKGVRSVKNVITVAGPNASMD